MDITNREVRVYLGTSAQESFGVRTNNLGKPWQEIRHSCSRLVKSGSLSVGGAVRFQVEGRVEWEGFYTFHGDLDELVELARRDIGSL